MNRKTKILFVVAFIVLGVIAIVFWPGEDEGTFSITYAGISTNNPSRALFTITNGFKHSVAYCTIFRESAFGRFNNFDPAVAALY